MIHKGIKKEETSLSSCVTRKLRSEGDEKCNLLPRLPHQNVVWVVDRSYGKTFFFFEAFLGEKKEWAVLIDKGAMSPWWVEVEMILGFR